MPFTHRGVQISGNHRSTPRLQQAIARELSRKTLIAGKSNRLGSAQDIIEAHRQGSPLDLGRSVSTGPVYSGLRPYIGYNEYSSVMNSGRFDTPYDNGMDDAYGEMVYQNNLPYKVNRAVSMAGGTKEVISSAFKNRHKSESDEYDAEL